MMRRLLMLSVLMLSRQICHRVSRRNVNMTIVPRDIAACGNLLWMAMRSTLRKGRRRAGRAYCGIVMSRQVQWICCLSLGGLGK